MMSSGRSGWLRTLLCVLLLLALVAVLGWYYLFRQVDVHYESDVEHFKYGSIGVEASSGVPLKLWQVFPEICQDKLDKPVLGYRNFGFNWEPGKPTPVGMPIKTVGFERVGISCSLCHSAEVRTEPFGPARLYMGAPSSTIDLQGYLRFLYACADNPAFTADNLLAAIALKGELGPVERLLYRYLIIPQTKKALQQQALQMAWVDSNPDWGPGRQDPFNPAKTQILRLPYDGSTGNADIPPLWNMQARKGHAFHWDGLNTSFREVVLNSAIGNGASAASIDLDGLNRVQAFVEQLSPSPFPFAIKPDLASRGETLFAQHCAGCHVEGGENTGKPVPIDKLGTDRERLGIWSLATAEAFMAQDDYDWQYHHFRDSWGYVAPPLDGIWIRAPYLHNGSVPSLRALLNAPERRPAIFYTGYNVYDPVDMGFVSRGAEAEAGFRFDTGSRGNGNGGHYWGSDLAAKDKDALIEYMKTL